MFLLAPVYKRVFVPFASFKDLKILKIWRHVYKIAWRSVSNKNGYRDLFPSKLTDPPMHGNADCMKIRASWQGVEGTCDGCENTCCEQIKCPLFSEKRRCLCYGSLYFGYYFCGRYPSSPAQVLMYNCPKWE